jgi:hypothetical protein
VARQEVSEMSEADVTADRPPDENSGTHADPVPLSGDPRTAAGLEKVGSGEAMGRWMALIEEAGRHEPGFGGVWIDHRGDGALHLGLSGDMSRRAVARLTASFPPDQKATVVEVAHSLRELEATQDHVTEAVLASASLRRHVVESAVVPAENAVVLTVTEGAPADQISTLREKYPALDVRVSSGRYATQ